MTYSTCTQSIVNKTVMSRNLKTHLIVIIALYDVTKKPITKKISMLSIHIEI